MCLSLGQAVVDGPGTKLLREDEQSHGANHLSEPSNSSPDNPVVPRGHVSNDSRLPQGTGSGRDEPMVLVEKRGGDRGGGCGGGGVMWQLRGSQVKPRPLTTAK